MRSDDRNEAIRIRVSPQQREILAELAQVHKLTLSRLVRMILFENVDLNNLSKSNPDPAMRGECKQELRDLVETYISLKLFLSESQHKETELHKEAELFMDKAESFLLKLQNCFEGKTT